MAVASVGRGRRGVGAGVGDAEAAAQVDLGQLDPGLGGERRRAAGGSGGRRPRSPRHRRSASRCGSGCRPAPAPARRAGRSASSAWPPAMEKPNFWSSWAVAMYSWVCASTPVVTRTMTRGRSPSPRRRPADRAGSISSKESTMIRPTPASRASSSSVLALVVAVQPDRARVDPGPQGHGQLAPGADVDAEALLGDPAGDGRAAGRTCRRSRRPSRRRPSAKSRARVAQVVLVEHVDRRADLLRDLGDRQSRDREHALGVLADVALQSAGSRSLTSLGHRQPARRAAQDVGVDRARDMHVGHRLTLSERVTPGRMRPPPGPGGAGGAGGGLCGGGADRT